MIRSRSTRKSALKLLLLGSALLAVGDCAPRDFAETLGQSVANRTANLLLESYFFDPFTEALDRRDGVVGN